jgi:hypothetical protein
LTAASNFFRELIKTDLQMFAGLAIAVLHVLVADRETIEELTESRKLLRHQVENNNIANSGELN